MTDEDKKLIAGYMGWDIVTVGPKKRPYKIYVDSKDCNIHHEFDPNCAGVCVQEMQKRGEWTDYRLLAVTIWMNTKSDCEDITAWLMTIEDRQAKNFFKAFTEWRKGIKLHPVIDKESAAYMDN